MNTSKVRIPQEFFSSSLSLPQTPTWDAQGLTLPTPFFLFGLFLRYCFPVSPFPSPVRPSTVLRHSLHSGPLPDDARRRPRTYDDPLNSLTSHVLHWPVESSTPPQLPWDPYPGVLTQHPLLSGRTGLSVSRPGVTPCPEDYQTGGFPTGTLSPLRQWWENEETREDLVPKSLSRGNRNLGLSRSPTVDRTRDILQSS